MTNQPQNTDNAPLFQDMDEQERTYAPQEVPGATMPAEEVDRGGTAGQATAADAGDHEPFVPVRPDTSINQPVVAPAGTYRDSDQMEEDISDPDRDSDQ
jgi:hypothetical protein